MRPPGVRRNRRRGSSRRSPRPRGRHRRCRRRHHLLPRLGKPGRSTRDPGAAAALTPVGGTTSPHSSPTDTGWLPPTSPDTVTARGERATRSRPGPTRSWQSPEGRASRTISASVHGDPAEVITDRAPALANVIDELVPAAWHNTGQCQNNRVECDHGRLKARLRPMRGLKTHRTANVVSRGHAFIQNLRRGHYELAVDATRVFRLATAFDELRPAI
jgi:hypothetical protein